MTAVTISGITEVKAMLAQITGRMREVDRYSQNAMAYSSGAPPRSASAPASMSSITSRSSARQGYQA